GLCLRAREHVGLVQVNNRVAAPCAGIEDFPVCTAAGLFAETGERKPQDVGLADIIEVDIRRFNAHIRRFWLAVKVQWEIIRWKDFTQRQRSLVGGVSADILIIHSRRSSSRRRYLPSGSLPTRDSRAELRPCRAAATETFAAEPPKYLPKVETSSS